MAKFTYTKTVNTDGLTEEQVLEKIKQNFSQNLDCVSVKPDKKNGGMKIYGRIKTKILTPILAFSGNAKLVDGNGGTKRLVVEGKTVTTWFFWFTFLVCLSFLPLFLVMPFMWGSQKNKIDENMREALEKFKNDLD